MQIELRKIDDDHVFAIPEDIRAALKWERGDIFRLDVEGETLKITRVQTAYGHAMQIARKAMKQYRAVFEALAKT